MLIYHAAFHTIEDGWYMAKLLDFPGVITQGRDLGEARFMIRDALKLMAEVYMEEGRPLPAPNPRARSKNAAFVEEVCLSARVTRGQSGETKKTA